MCVCVRERERERDLYAHQYPRLSRDHFKNRCLSFNVNFSHIVHGEMFEIFLIHSHVKLLSMSIDI